MNPIYLVFSGQGSQTVGMGYDFYQQYDFVKKIYDIAEAVSNYPIKEISFSNESLLNQTQFTQVSLFTFYQAVLAILNHYQVESSASLGLSLGEYGAYLDNDVFDFQTGINIVKNRAIYMEEATKLYPGKMAAVIGINANHLEALIQKHHSPVTIANYNTHEQLVLSALVDDIDALSSIIKETSSARIIPLNTSCAFHSTYMTHAKSLFANFLSTVELNEPTKNLWLNTTGHLYQGDIKEVMAEQIVSSVKFYQTIENISKNEEPIWIEVGPKKVLLEMIKKINPFADVHHISNMSSLKSTLDYLGVNHGII